MIDSPALAVPRLLTLPESSAQANSIRAKALLFRDPRSAGLLEHVERIARSEASVLVVGETGTGKELIARHLHKRSGRSGPFLAVNCGAFSESLIDAELFGHEVGAFTGATQSRAGWFEAAQAGTLFLDEIGDLPLTLQVKLLRVLQERQVVRLGSRKAIPVDVRVVAATNIDPRLAVEAQRFRADLYYRLSVATVQLPPLRERCGDILALAQHFIGIYAPRLGLASAALTKSAEHALLAYPWPGNIRELENAIHFALIVCRQGLIEPGDLKLVAPLALPPSADETIPAARAVGAPMAPLEFTSPGHEPDALAVAIDALLEQRTPGLLRHVEATLVRAACARVGDNQVRAARLLGVTRNTLRTLLKRHGLLAESGLANLASDSSGVSQAAAH